VAGTITRAIRLAVLDGTVAIESFRQVGAAGETELGRVGRGAANANAALEGMGRQADATSRQGRAAFLNISNQAQDFIVQVQGGTDAFRAFSQQAPQALDAVAVAMGGLAPGLGVLVTVAATAVALVPTLVALAGAHGDAATAAEAQAKSTDALLKTLDVSTASADKFTASLRGLSAQQAQLAGADLAAAADKAAKAYGEALTKVQATVNARVQVAQVAVADAPAGPDQGPRTAQIQAAAQRLRDVFASFQQGAPVLDQLMQSLADLDQALGRSGASATKAGDTFRAQLEAVEPLRKGYQDAAAAADLFKDANDQSARAAMDAKDILRQATSELEKWSGVLGRSRISAVAEEMKVLGASTEQVTNYVEAATAALERQDEQTAKTARTKETMERLGVSRTEATALVEDAAKVNDALDERGKKLAEITQVERELRAGLLEQEAANDRILALRQQVLALDVKDQESVERVARGYEQAVRQSEARLARTDRGEDMGAAMGAAGAAAAGAITPPTAEQLKLLPQLQQEYEKTTRKVYENAAANVYDTEFNKANTEAIQAGVQAQEDAARAAKTASDERARAHAQDVKTLAELQALLLKSDNPLQAAADAAATRMSKFATGPEIEQARDAARQRAADVELAKGSAEAEAGLNEERQRAQALLAQLSPVEEQHQRNLDEIATLYDDGALGLKDSNEALAARQTLLSAEIAKMPVLLRQREQLRRREAAENALATEGPFAGGIHAGFLQIQSEAEDTGRTIASALGAGFDAVSASFVDMLNGGEDGFASLSAAALSFVKTLEQVIIKMLIVQAVEAAIGFGFGGGAGAASQTPTTTTIGGVYHGGGVVGDGAGGSRSLPSWLFAAAARAHGGLMLGPDEIPIVARRGERVLSPEETRAYGGRGAAAAVISHAPTYNISGVTDVRVLQAVVEASSAKALTDLERRWRSDPMSRRATVGH
jgi:lambda family phage tail tape measure protein